MYTEVTQADIASAVATITKLVIDGEISDDDQGVIEQALSILEALQDVNDGGSPFFEKE